MLLLVKTTNQYKSFFKVQNKPPIIAWKKKNKWKSVVFQLQCFITVISSTMYSVHVLADFRVPSLTSSSLSILATNQPTQMRHFQQNLWYMYSISRLLQHPCSFRLYVSVCGYRKMSISTCIFVLQYNTFQISNIGLSLAPTKAATV